MIEHNTVIDEVYDPARYTNGRFLKLSGVIDNLSIANNVYDPNGTPLGAFNSTGLSLAISAINMDIGGNVWGPSPRTKGGSIWPG